MNIKFLDLQAQYKTIKPEIDEVVADIIESQYFILGEPVKKLEKEIAEYCGTKYAIGVASGTDALIVSLRSLGIGPGDEVITTPFTFFASVGAIWNAGAKAAMVDILPDTFNMDPSKLEAAITEKTKAIIPIHLFGQCCDMGPIMEIANKHNIPVIEDSAQSIGAKYKGKKAGAMGATGAFSFFPSKNLGAFGDGGIITTNDDELAEMLSIVRVHGSSKQYHHCVVGFNSRLDSLQAAVLSVKLKYLDQWHEGRRKHAYKYNEAFANLPVITPVELYDTYCIYNQYTLRVPNGKRDELREFLSSKGVPSAVYYPLSLHMQPCFQSLGYKEGDFPISEQASNEVVSLPVYPEFPEEHQNKVIEEVINFYK